MFFFVRQSKTSCFFSFFDTWLAIQTEANAMLPDRMMDSTFLALKFSTVCPF